MFLNTAISVEDCFEILVGMKALFPASGFRQNFEMAHSGGVVDRDFPIFAHGEIDITRKHHFLPFLVNLNHSKSCPARSRSSPRMQYQAPDPKLAPIPSWMQKERCARDMLRLRDAY